MKYFELKNTKTQATAQVVAKNLMEAYRQLGWKPQHGRLIWKADSSAANDKGEYWATIKPRGNPSVFLNDFWFLKWNLFFKTPLTIIYTYDIIKAQKERS